MLELLKPSWSQIDPAELRFILLEHIGKPGQYHDRASNPNTFYLPLAGDSCQLKLTFGKNKQVISINPGPAFDNARWQKVVEDIEFQGSKKVGRDISFSSFRVDGSWRGQRSGVQILPPADAPQSPYEMGEHPFIIEFPIIESRHWAITNFRRRREHRQFTYLLNILLSGHTKLQSCRPRHLWAIVPEEFTESSHIKWVQEFYFAKFGEAVIENLSPTNVKSLTEAQPKEYYDAVGHDGASLRVPADLDDSICSYLRLSKANRDKFCLAGFWMDMAHRQWTISLSASFASVAIAIEALGDRTHGFGPTKRFSTFIERFAPNCSTESRRKEMYALRSDLLHGSGLFETDREADFGWSPAELNDKDLMGELWAVTRIAIRNWLKNPLPA